MVEEPIAGRPGATPVARNASTHNASQLSSRKSLQLFLGGRHPELRTGNVLKALPELAVVGVLTDRTVASLRDAYTWLRRAEHAQQLVEEQQTSAFPRDPAEQTALARRMGYVEADAERSRAALLGDWTSVRDEVRGHFDALVLRRAE